MVQNFTIKGAHSTTIRQRLLQGIMQHWKLAKHTQTNLLALYQLQGLSNHFFDELNKKLSKELDLSIVPVLQHLGFEQQYHYNSQTNHVILYKIFLHWLKFSFYSEELDDDNWEQRNTFLTKESLMELVDWIILCGYILAEEEIPSCYKNCRMELLERAMKYCTELRRNELIEGFLIEMPLYHEFREEVRTCLFDCFYWYMEQGEVVASSS